MLNNLRKQTGVTLVELMIAVALFTLLLVIAIPNCRFSIGCSPEMREDEGSRILSTTLGVPDEQS